MAYRGGNFSFVVEPSFQPFTMQEMLVPFAAYKDAYEKAEEGYLDLSSKADKFKYLSETLPENSKARQLYEGYAGFLATQAEDLARNGFNMANRSALTSLKRRYQGEIGRLVDADTALKKEQELRRTMNVKDSSMLYAANNLTIDDFLDGNSPNLYGISGNELYVRGAATGKAASSRIFNIGDGGSTLGGYYRDWVSKNGYSPERINEFRRNVAAIPELQQAVDDILVEKGVKGNLTGAAYERARQSIINGIIDGAVYTEVHKPEIDRGVMSAAEADNSRRGWAELRLKELEVAAKAKAAEAAANAAGEGNTGVGPNPMNIYSQKDARETKDNLKKFSQYFFTASDGTTRMTKAGLDEYNKKYNRQNTGQGTATGYYGNYSSSLSNTDSPFKMFIDSIGGADYASKKQVGNLGNLWNQYKSAHADGNKVYDATKRTEFDYSLDSSQQDSMKQKVLSAAREQGKLEEIDIDDKTGRFKSTGDKISLKDLASDDYTVVATRISPYGNSVMIQNKKEGETRRYKLPSGINPTAEANVNNLMQYAEFLQRNRNGGNIRIPDNIAQMSGLPKGTVRNFTPEQIQQEYARVIQEATLHLSQLGLVNKTKPQEFNPYSN